MRTLAIIFKAILRLCLFQYRPQDLPASALLWTLMLLFYMTMSSLLAPSSLSIQLRLLWAIVEAALLVTLVSSLLYATKRPRRILQTLTAMLGSNSLLSLLSLPFVFWLERAQSNNSDAAIPAIFLLTMMFWNLMVYIYVLRHALNVSAFMATIVATILLALMGSVLLSIFPVTAL